MRSRILRWGITLIRLFLGGIFFTGGISKLMPFPGVMGPVWLEEVLEPHGLGLYARFIAWSELLIGLLLLSLRFATLGAIMLVPLVLNILMVTISMNWRGTPYVVSFFLMLNVCLLIYDFPKWRPLLAAGAPQWGSGPPPVMADRRSTLACLALCACVMAGPCVYGVSATGAYGLIGAAFLGLWGIAIVRGTAVPEAT